MSIHNGQDIIDSRDVIARIEELEDEHTTLVEDVSFASAALDIAVTKAAEDKSEALTEAEADAQETYVNARLALEEWDDDNADEFKALQDLDSEGRDATSEWKHGEPLIRDSYFEDYAMQLADDIGAIDRNAEWPVNCIDWKQAAEQLQQDYSSVNFEGEDYWIRSN